MPKFILYGQAGFSAYNFTNIFGNHTFKSLAGVVPSFDLFTGGAKMARLRWTKLELEKAQQMYEKTVLTSIQEVNDSLNGKKTREKNYKESEKRYNLENEKYRDRNPEDFNGIIIDGEKYNDLTSWFIKKREALYVIGKQENYIIKLLITRN